jgi:7,8-dihydropterin-6-yl-methyl-4-(beta-D-ribofuranosyl)aminobenzene 5'-phosphate synthase
LLVLKDGELQVDDFKHEQNLLINENDKNILVVGCAHKGILNIINRAEEIVGKELDYVIGGFHLKNPLFGRTDDQKDILTLAKKLKTKKTIYYTGHCTGKKAYKILNTILGGQLHTLSTGKVIEI